MARVRDIVFDCRHPASLARFWAAALTGYGVAPYDEAELERLRTQGIGDTEDDPTVLVLSETGGMRFWFQRVPEAKVAKNRVHLDLEGDDPEAEIERLIALGAIKSAEQPNEGKWVALRDPEGNEFDFLLA